MRKVLTTFLQDTGTEVPAVIINIFLPKTGMESTMIQHNKLILLLLPLLTTCLHLHTVEVMDRLRLLLKMGRIGTVKSHPRNNRFHHPINIIPGVCHKEETTLKIDSKCRTRESIHLLSQLDFLLQPRLLQMGGADMEMVMNIKVKYMSHEEVQEVHLPDHCPMEHGIIVNMTKMVISEIMCTTATDNQEKVGRQ